MRLVERDYTILKEIYRWRVCLGRHIQELVGFTSRSACEQRLRKLIEMGYIKRQHVLYGVAAHYLLNHKGRVLINVSRKLVKIRPEQIFHDITVLDAVLFFIRSKGLKPEDFTSEKEMQSQNGFGDRIRRPDFLIHDGDKTICVEVELSPKSRTRTEKILTDNYLSYYRQLWIVPSMKHKVAVMLSKYLDRYPNMEIMELKEINSNILCEEALNATDNFHSVNYISHISTLESSAEIQPTERCR